MDSEFIQSIFDNVHTAIIVLRTDLTVECMNPSAEMMLQISENRAISRHISDLVIEARDFVAQLETCATSRHPYTVYAANLRFGTTEQSIQVDYMVSPVERNRGEPYILIEFISKSRHHRFEQEDMLMRQHDASKSLLRGLAHEIKNPLGGLRGAAQLLERELDEESREYTDIIIREADRLQSLVDRMLGPNNLPEKKELNIHRVLEHVRQLIEAEPNDVEIISDYDPSIPDVWGDESMLIQAVLNITRNAINVIRESSIKDGRIIFRTRSLRKGTIGNNTYPLVLKLSIIDNGPGISEELIDSIFFPMVTSRAEGTGLGLSISQSLIQQHCGLIECQSQPGETNFTILLPLENGHE